MDILPVPEIRSFPAPYAGKWTVDGNDLYARLIVLDYMSVHPNTAEMHEAHKYCLEKFLVGLYLDGDHYSPFADPLRPRVGPHSKNFIVELYPMLCPASRTPLAGFMRRWPQWINWNAVRAVPRTHVQYLPKAIRDAQPRP